MDGSTIAHGARELPKRSRAALACNACRKVKSKCDGGRPVCGRCSRQSSECTYTLNVHDRRMDRQEERRAHLALKHKVSELEAKLKRAAAAASATSATSTGATHSTASPGSMGSSLHGDSPIPLPLTQPQPTSNGLSEEGHQAATNNTPGSAVDSLATGAFDHRPAAEIGYFGPTSNHAMFRSVTSAMVNSGYRLSVLRQQDQEGEAAAGGKHQMHQMQHTQPTTLHQASNPRDLPSSISIAAETIGAAMRDDMPSQAVARQWVTHFFDTVGSVLPYVNESAILRDLAMPSFLATNGPLQSSAISSSASTATSIPTSTSIPRSMGRRRSRATESLLNIVFAHALVAIAAQPQAQPQSHSQSQSQSQSEEAAAEPFYHRAVSLVLQDEQAVSTQTTQTVQALLLLGSFQQNSQRAMASLATHALAVKASYQLGLHSPATYDGLSASDKELRAELWFAVVNQDMILATALGRPCLIPPSYVQYKMLDMLSSASSTSAESISVHYFRHVSSLHQIMGKAVESIYGSNIGGLSELEPREFVSRTMDLVFQLQAWRASIQPSSFSIWPPPENEQSDSMYNWSTSKFQSERYSLCLSVYYYKTMMIVCAPLLMRVLEEVTDSAGSSSSGSHGVHGATIGNNHNRSHSTKPMQAPATPSSSLLLEMAVPVLRKELHAVAAYQRIATSLMHRNPSFFKINAIWWVCNFNSLTMSLHLFALWLVCMLSDGISSALETSVGAVESLLLEAVSILRGIGGTSLMSTKAYHSLQRYMRLARAIAPMRAPTRGQPAASQVAGMHMEQEVLLPGHGLAPGPDGHNQYNGNSSGTTNANANTNTNSAVPTVIDPQVPINFDELLLHEPHQGALFTGGAFLWDGFPDASMNIVGDMYYQQMDGDFLNSGLQGFQGM